MAAQTIADHLDPEAVLAKELRDFEADLTIEWLSDFRHTRTPWVDDVMRLTAELDRICVASGARRCYGPRLTSFLDAIQNFAVAEDARSTRLLGSRVWAAATISLRAMTTMPSHLDQLTALFMDLGTSAPRSRELYLVYPESTRLQHAILEYYILITQLFHWIYTSTHVSKMRRLFGFDKRISDYRLRLERWSLAARDEISIVTMQKQLALAKESSMSTKFKSLALSNMTAMQQNKNKNREMKIKMKIRLLDACSQYDYKRSWRALRAAGNTDSFSTTVEYTAWRTQKTSSTLIYSDRVGVGKSVLVANMVDNLFLTSPSHTSKLGSTVAYFFCLVDVKESLYASTILGSLAHQIIQGIDEDDNSLETLYSVLHNNDAPLSEYQLCEIVRSCLSLGREIFFILDGLNECAQATTAIVLDLLGSLQSFGTLHLCIASRPIPELHQSAFRLKNSVIVPIPENRGDIEKYVRLELMNLISSGQLVVSDPALVHEISIALIDKGDRNFLWVSQQLLALTQQTSDADIRGALNDFPANLSDVYNRMLFSANERLTEYRVPTLELLLMAKRPLTVDELREALIIVPGHDQYNTENILNNISTAIASCGGLVVVDENDSTVKFTHLSVRQFLTHGQSAVLNYTTSSNNMIARLLTYINYDFMDIQMMDIVHQPSKIPRTLNIEERLKAMQNFQRIHPFASYVKEFWCDHLADFDVNESLCANLLRTALQNSKLNGLSGRGAETLLVRSVVWNHVELFKILLEYPRSLSTTDRANALRIAEAGNRDEFLKIMIDSSQFKTTSNTYQLSFVIALLESLHGYLEEKEQLDKVIRALPYYLDTFAYRLRSHYDDLQAGDDIQSILNHQSIVVDLFQERLLAGRQGKLTNTISPAVQWQDRVGLLGPLMTEAFMHIDPMELPRPEDDSLPLNDLAYSETMSQISTTFSELTDDTYTSSLDDTDFVKHPRIANLSMTDSSMSRETSTINPTAPIDDADPPMKVLSIDSNSPDSAGAMKTTGININRLLKSAAYLWLVSQIQIVSRVTEPKNNVFTKIRQGLGEVFDTELGADNSPVPSERTVYISLNWDLQDFLDGHQFGDTEDVAHLLRNYLTLSSDGSSSQALSTKQYLQQTWGKSSDAVLTLVSIVASSKYGILKGPGYEIEAWDSESQIILKATGFLPEITEILEQITWIGSSMRCGPSKRVLYHCFPVISGPSYKRITLQKSQKVISGPGFDIRYDISETRSQESVDCCWQSLFQYPILAMGFPVAVRDPSIPGLEMNLGSMISLSQSQHIGKFDDAIVIKGHYTVFVLSKRENQSCVWHVSTRVDESYVSYSDIQDAGQFPHTSLHEIKGDRHFIGWCPRSTYGAGFLSSDYTIKPSYTDQIVAHDFFAKRQILRPIKVEMDTVYIARDKGEPRQAKHTSYRKDIHRLHTNYIVLWDVASGRGWLANGTSVLLHLVLASLNHEAKHALTSYTQFDIQTLQSVSQEAEKAAAAVLLNASNLELVLYPEDIDDRETFKERVQDIYHFLQIMIAYQLTASEKGLLSSVQLEGWDFIDTADTNTELLRPRFIPLDETFGAWRAALADIWAVTLFGRDFGKIFEPQSHTTCNYWSELPKGQSYLAASVRDLKQIMEKHGNPLKEPKRLTHSTVWTILSATFEECDCRDSTMHRTLLQHLVAISDHQRYLMPIGETCDAPHHGAVIFGPTLVSGISEDSAQDSAVSNKVSVSDSLQEHVSRLSLTGDTPGGEAEQEQVRNDTSIPSIPKPLQIMPTHSDFLVEVVCALPKELQAVKILFDAKYEQVNYNTSDPYSYAFGKIGEHNVVAACLPKGRYGNCSATAVGTHLYNSFRNIKFALLVGIGGGVPLDTDIRLGDVVVSSGNPGVVKYDFHKTRQGQANELLGGSLRTPLELDSIISQLTSDLDSQELLQPYLQAIAKQQPAYAHPGRQFDVLYSAEHIHVGRGACVKCKGRVVPRQDRPSDQPQIHYGVIASGDQVMKDAKIRDRLGRQYKALCFEMEAGGLCHLNKDCLVIRGICDYSDSHKHDIWQNYASAAAAAYAKALLSRLRPLTS